MSRATDPGDIGKQVRRYSRPRLKIARTADRPVGHRAAAKFGGTAAVIMVEVFTFAEWDRIPAVSRPLSVVIVPGIGYIDLTLWNAGVPTSHESEFEYVREVMKAETELRNE